MIRLGQGAVAELGVHLVRRTLMLPLRAFEAIDPSALLAALTEDIAILAGALVGVPHLCINIPIVVACLVLRRLALAGDPGVRAGLRGAGDRGLRRADGPGHGGLRRPATRQDAVVGHFRTAIGGFRELKLHRGRREAFLAESLEPDVAAARVETVRGLTHFAVADGWGQLAFFGFIGLPALRLAADRADRRAHPGLGRALVLYLMTPLDIVLTWVPVLGRRGPRCSRSRRLLPELERHGRGGARPARPRPAPGARSSRSSLEGVTFTLPRPGRRPRLRARARST